MAHSMISPSTTVTTPITTTRSKHQHQHQQPPSLGFLRVSASSCQGSGKTQDDKFINRRSVTLSLAAGVVVVGLSGGQSEAAGRRPSPPPAEEKKDPNVSGVQAKVLASKKRKEAMKESVAKLREKGKSINN